MHEAELLLRNDTLVHAHRSLLTKSSAVPVEVEPLVNPPSISAVHGTTLPGSRRPAHSLRRLSARPLSSHSARRAGRHVMPAFCSLRWPFDMPTQGAMTLLQLRLQSFRFAPFWSKRKCSIHQSIERNRDPIWRFCEEGQRGVSGFTLDFRIRPLLRFSS